MCVFFELSGAYTGNIRIITIEREQNLILSNDKNKHGLNLALWSLLIMLIVLGFYIWTQNAKQLPLPPADDDSTYQTGKAFELTKPDPTATEIDEPTAEELIGEADRIVAKARAIIAQHPLSEIEVKKNQKQQSENRIKNVEKKLDKLVNQHK